MKVELQWIHGTWIDQCHPPQATFIISLLPDFHEQMCTYVMVRNTSLVNWIR
jgi:hypothetical protein